MVDRIGPTVMGTAIAGDWRTRVREELLGVREDRIDRKR